MTMNGQTDGPVFIPATVVANQPGIAGWFKQNVAGHLLTLIVGGACGIIGAWYTLQDKVEHHTERIVQLELNSASRDEMKLFMEGIGKQLDSIDRRLGRMEQTAMDARNK